MEFKVCPGLLDILLAIEPDMIPDNGRIISQSLPEKNISRPQHASPTIPQNRFKAFLPCLKMGIARGHLG